jgi:PEP-CTERM motif
MISRLTLAIASAGLLSMTCINAHAVAALPSNSVFELIGICEDCTLNSTNGLIGTLTLSNYTIGTPIDTSNFVSFEYVGSDIVDPFTVVPNPEFPDYILNIAGVMDPSSNNSSFSIAYEDNLRFGSIANANGPADWFTCGRGPNGYYSGSQCNIVINQDFGSAVWSAAAVPEPSTSLTFGLGLLGLGGVIAARRQKKANNN